MKQLVTSLDLYNLCPRKLLLLLPIDQRLVANIGSSLENCATVAVTRRTGQSVMVLLLLLQSSYTAPSKG